MKAFVLKEGESEVAKFRQSVAVLAGPFIKAFVVLALPGWYIQNYELWDLAAKFFIILTLVVVFLLAHHILLWYLDVYRITTQRFIKSTYRTIFHQHVTETALERILNISFKTTGPWSVLAGFGDVELQVVGKMEPIVVKHVKNPAMIKEYLLRLHEQLGGIGDAKDPVEMSKHGTLPGNR